jgi:hypothetical protein
VGLKWEEKRRETEVGREALWKYGVGKEAFWD